MSEAPSPSAAGPRPAAALRHDSGFPRPDDAFTLLVDAHRGLDPEASQALDARLVLLLANHIGDEAVLREAIAAAVRSLPARAAGGTGSGS